MRYSIEIKASAEKDMGKLPRDVHRRAAEKILVRLQWKAICVGLLCVAMAASCGARHGGRQPDAAGTGDIPRVTDHGVAPDGGSRTKTDAAADCAPDCRRIPDVPGVTDTVDVAPDAGQADQAEVTKPPKKPPYGWLSSPELGIRITGPAPANAQAAGSTVKLAGLIAGDADHVYVEAPGGKLVQAHLDTFATWVSDQVKLEPGDNAFQVVATRGDEEAKDHITVTSNLAHLFGRLDISPQALFADTVTVLSFRTLPFYWNFEPDTLEVCRWTEDGECAETAFKLMDDGDLDSSGDELAGDRVYHALAPFGPEPSGKACFRIRSTVHAGLSTYEARSPITCIDVVEHIEQATCEAIRLFQQDAAALYWDVAAADDVGAARQAVLDMLGKSPLVGEAGTSFEGNGIWIRYKDGLLGALDLSLPGMRGGSGDDGTGAPAPLVGRWPFGLQSRRALILSPAHDELGDEDEAVAGWQMLVDSTCPAFMVEPPQYGEDASLDRFRSLRNYGLIVFAGHGDSYFRELSPEARAGYGWRTGPSQELLWTGEPVDCSEMVQTTPECTGGDCPPGSQCVLRDGGTGICVDLKQVDLRTGRAVFGTHTYGILPSFVAHYSGTGYPASLLYLGACRSMWNLGMAMEFRAFGAEAVVGYSDYVTSSYAYLAGTKFLTGMAIKLKSLSETMAGLPPEDPDIEGTVPRFLGNPEWDLSDSGLLNAGFEQGSLAAWLETGHVPVTMEYCGALPPQAKYLAMLTAGLLPGLKTAELEQAFCVPEGETTMTFYWRAHAAEQQQMCGTESPVLFEAVLESGANQTTCASVKLADLCPPESCDGCGSFHNGLAPPECKLGGGAAWWTSWHKAECDVAALAGQGRTTLRLKASAADDSGVTIVLVDSFHFE